jgi:hypothetical protein
MRTIVEVRVRANPSEVWPAVSTVGGENRELSPFVRMTDPTKGAHFDTEPWKVRDLVLWQLLFGIIPIDRHQVELIALPDERGFRESSSSWWHRVWRHERTLLDHPEGCIIRDDVEIAPRVGVLDPIVERAVSQMFRRRHRYLHRQFG